MNLQTQELCKRISSDIWSHFHEIEVPSVFKVTGSGSSIHSAVSHLEILLFEDERRRELAPLLGEIHLDEPVPFLPGGLPESSVWLSNDYEPLLNENMFGCKNHRGKSIKMLRL